MSEIDDTRKAALESVEILWRGPKDEAEAADCYWSIRRALEAPAVPEWQPIETAPKEGQWLILAWGGATTVARWLDNTQTSHPWAGWSLPSMWSSPKGKPTHWMSLPAAPEPSDD